MAFGRSAAILLVAALAASFVLSSPSRAGVVDGVRTVDDLVIYLGVVPASVTRGHPAEHPESTMHGGVARATAHDIHLVVAVFRKGNGQRVTNAVVTARVQASGSGPRTVRLEPMTINRSLTYGGYVTLGGFEDATITIDVTRPNLSPAIRTKTARFDYVHD